MLYIYDVLKIYPLSLIISINNYILLIEVKKEISKTADGLYVIFIRSSG